MNAMKALLALLLCSPLLLAQNAAKKDKLAWVKYDLARQIALKTGKPILIYSVGDTGATIDLRHPTRSNPGLDLGFLEEFDRKKAAQFILVKAAEMKTQNAVGGGDTEVLFQDPDGELIHKAKATNLNELDAAANDALRKFSDKPISWETYPGNLDALRDSKKLLVLAFAKEDGKEDEEMLKVLENAWIAKLHPKCAFQKVVYAKDSEDVNKWGVHGAPTLLLADPSKEAGSKAVIERISSKQSVRHLKNALQKALQRIEKGS